MPKGLLQEKFQRTVERSKREDREWSSFSSARRPYNHPSQHYTTSEQKKAHTVGGLPPDLSDFDAPRTNMMPPGMEIADQLPTVRNYRDGGLAGSSDESNSVNAAMLSRGFQRQSMKPEDEMYNDEHVELFYGTAEVDGDVGFVERNNYLDRE